MVTVPVRVAPVFAAQETVTVAGPLPDPAVGFTVSHATFEEAVHVPVHPAGDPVTVTPVEPAAAVGLAVPTLREYPHAPTPAWLTVNALPAIVADPARADPVFVVHATVTLVGPLPDPLIGLTLSQDAFDPAVQLPEQPAGDPVTVTVV